MIERDWVFGEIRRFRDIFLHNFSRRGWGGEEVPKKGKGGNEKGGEEKERMEEEEEKERGTVRLNWIFFNSFHFPQASSELDEYLYATAAPIRGKFSLFLNWKWEVCAAGVVESLPPLSPWNKKKKKKHQEALVLRRLYYSRPMPILTAGASQKLI